MRNTDWRRSGLAHWGGRALLCGLVFFVASVGSSPAHAGCTKDTDCKADRICEQGQCVDPVGSSTLSTAAAPASPGLSTEKLLRLGGNRYAHGPLNLDWAGAERVLRTYSRSDETLRKGAGTSAVGTIGAVTGGLMIGLGIGFVIAGHADDDVPSDTGGTRVVGCADDDDECEIASRIFLATGSVVGFGIGLPFSLIGGTAKQRAIERYNRAVEEGLLTD